MTRGGGDSPTAGIPERITALYGQLGAGLPTRGEFTFETGPELALWPAFDGDGRPAAPPVLVPHGQILRAGRRVLSVLPWSVADPLAGIRLELCTLEGEWIASLAERRPDGDRTTTGPTTGPATWWVVNPAATRTGRPGGIVAFQGQAVRDWLSGGDGVGPDGEARPGEPDGEADCGGNGQSDPADTAAGLAIRAWRSGRAALIGAVDAASLSGLPMRAAAWRAQARRHDHAHALLALTEAARGTGRLPTPALTALRDRLAAGSEPGPTLAVDLLIPLL